MGNYNVVIVYKYESYYLNSKLPVGKYSTNYRKVAVGLPVARAVFTHCNFLAF